MAMRALRDGRWTIAIAVVTLLLAGWAAHQHLQIRQQEGLVEAQREALLLAEQRAVEAKASASSQQALLAQAGKQAEHEIARLRRELARLRGNPAAEVTTDEPEPADAVSASRQLADARERIRRLSELVDTTRHALLSQLDVSALDPASRLLRDVEILAALVMAGVDGSSPREVLELEQSIYRLLAGWPELAVLKGHTAALRSATFSPDGRLVVTVSEDGTARVWDGGSGAPLAILAGHGDVILHAGFSPDSRRIITGADDRSARIWDAATGLELSLLAGHTMAVHRVTWRPDGGLAATASADGTAMLWDIEHGRPVARLAGHSAEIWDIAIDRSGEQLVTASEDRTVRLWSVSDGRLRHVLRGHRWEVHQAVFSPDGRHVATVSSDGLALLWSTSNGKLVGRFKGHEQDVWRVAFSPDGLRLATASRDNTARVWDATTGRQLAKLEGHGDWVVAVAFSPDGRLLATGSDDGTARLWDLESGTLRGQPLRHAGPVRSVAFEPNGKRLLTASVDGSARLWQTSPTPVARGLVTLEAYPKLASGASSGPPREAGPVPVLWTGGASARATSVARLTETGAVVAISPDGRHIVTTDGTTARLWDGETGALARVLSGHREPITQARFSPDGELLSTASLDLTARVWQVRTGAMLHVLQAHTKALRHSAFDAEARRLVTASDDGSARVWDLQTGRTTARLSGHKSPLAHAEFSRRGTRVATSSRDGEVRLWDIATASGVVIVEAGVLSPALSGDRELGPRLPFADTDALLAHVMAAAPRCLTPGERRAAALSPTPPPWCISAAKWPYDPQGPGLEPGWSR